MRREVDVGGVQFKADARGNKAFYIKNEEEISITLANSEDYQWLSGEVVSMYQVDLCKGAVIAAIQAKELELELGRT